MTISGERDFRTLPYLIASPAPRAPLFLGRSLVHILDGLISTIAAFIIGVLAFKINLDQANLWLTALSVLLIAVTSCGFGLIFGSLSLRTRDAWTITSVIYMALLVFSGANFPVEILPTSLRWISYGIPLTRGIAAARAAISGADWAFIQPMLIGELVVGIIYIGFGYLLFTLVSAKTEKKSHLWYEKDAEIQP
jgi:ABC-2 type transport system permease protein